MNTQEVPPPFGRRDDVARRGFTLIEVMIAAALLSVITAGAMAAFIAQSRITNTQQQTVLANDQSREAIRLISNDVRTAAAGMTPGAGGMSGCAQGTVPFDMGLSGGSSAIACLPPVFRSNVPMLPIAGGAVSVPRSALSSTPTCLAGSSSYAGYQLNYGGTNLEPPANEYFCPDDLVILAVDDTNPLFMVQSNPGFSSVGNGTSIVFAGTQTPPRAQSGSPINAGYGFDDSSPLSYLPVYGTAAPFCPAGISSAVLCQPMMLFGGPSGAVLMNVDQNGPAGAYAAPPASSGTCPYSAPAPYGTPCGTVSYNIVPQTATVDLIHNNLSFGSVGLPARLVQYSIEPVDVNNGAGCQANNTCVSANLVRSVVVPQSAAAGQMSFSVLSTTTVAKGVLDMQVEFGLAAQQQTSTTPGAQGNLLYVSSGGFQGSPWYPYPTSPTPNPPGASTIFNLDNCNGGTDGTVWNGVCFPTGGGTSLNALSLLRTVRLNFTTRSGPSIDTRNPTAFSTAASVAAPFRLQPAVQDITPTAAAGPGTAGNLEAVNWGYSPAAANSGTFLTIDGADYRQVSTEIYIRNLGWTNNL